MYNNFGLMLRLKCMHAYMHSSESALQLHLPIIDILITAMYQSKMTP